MVQSPVEGGTVFGMARLFSVLLVGLGTHF